VTVGREAGLLTQAGLRTREAEGRDGPGGVLRLASISGRSPNVFLRKGLYRNGKYHYT